MHWLNIKGSSKFLLSTFLPSFQQLKNSTSWFYQDEVPQEKMPPVNILHPRAAVLIDGK